MTSPCSINHLGIRIAHNHKKTSNIPNCSRAVHVVEFGLTMTETRVNERSVLWVVEGSSTGEALKESRAILLQTACHITSSCRDQQQSKATYVAICVELQASGLVMQDAHVG